MFNNYVIFAGSLNNKNVQMQILLPLFLRFLLTLSGFRRVMENRENIETELQRVNRDKSQIGERQY